MEPTKRVLDEKTRMALIGYAPFSSDSSINFIPFPNGRKENQIPPGSALCQSPS